MVIVDFLFLDHRSPSLIHDVESLPNLDHRSPLHLQYGPWIESGMVGAVDTLDSLLQEMYGPNISPR